MPRVHISDIGEVPEVRRARDKLAEVQHRLNALEAEIGAVHLRISDDEATQKRREKRREQVELLLEGGDLPVQTDLRRSLSGLEAERSLVLEAVTLARWRAKGAEQQAWLQVLQDCGLKALVWRPSQLQEVHEMLISGPR